MLDMGPWLIISGYTICDIYQDIIKEVETQAELEIIANLSSLLWLIQILSKYQN